MSRAFLEACQYGTHSSYRARINIIGHSGAGKTSLTRRLLGHKFQKEEESTDGIETHRIEFNLTDELNKRKELIWQEAKLKTEKLEAIFNEDVIGRRFSIPAHAFGNKEDETSEKFTEASLMPNDGEKTDDGMEVSPRVLLQLEKYTSEQSKEQLTEHRTRQKEEPQRKRTQAF